MQRRTGKLTSIGELLKQSKDIILRGADKFTVSGYTQVPNAILVHKDLSQGAKLTYAMLLKYAWQKDSCYPGQERLADDMGSSDRSVRTYLKELEGAGLVEIHQRGLGKPNLYVLDLTARSLTRPDRKIFPVRGGSNFRS